MQTYFQEMWLKDLYTEKQPVQDQFLWFFWDPRLPSVQSLTSKHYRSMTGLDPYLKEVFPEPPMVAFKRQRNIKDRIIKATIPIKFTRHQRSVPGRRKKMANV